MRIKSLPDDGQPTDEEAAEQQKGHFMAVSKSITIEADASMPDTNLNPASCYGIKQPSAS